MVAGIPVVLLAVLGIFAVFMIALAYAQLATRNLEMVGKR